MNPDILFQIVNVLVLPQWLLMIFLPRRSPTRFLLTYQPIILSLAVVYLYALFTSEPAEGGGFDSLEGLMAMFTSPTAVLAGWIHYLAFDLLAGSYILSDAAKRDIPHIAIVPCLFLCFMLGPSGILLYAIVILVYRQIQKRQGLRKA